MLEDGPRLLQTADPELFTRLRVALRSDSRRFTTPRTEFSPGYFVKSKDESDSPEVQNLSRQPGYHYSHSVFIYQVILSSRVESWKSESR